MPKITTTDSKKQRHEPFYKELSTQGGNLRTKTRGAYKNKNKDKSENDATEEYLDSSTSRKILQLAKEQQEEIEGEENEGINGETQMFSNSYEEDSSEDEQDQEAWEDEEFSEYSDYEEEEINEDDAALFDQYFKEGGSGFGGSYNLADKIMEKIREKEEMKQRAENPTVAEGVYLSPKVIEAYTKIGGILKTWKQGKLPKLFKFMPNSPNWADLLYVCNPEAWTANAVYEATKLFVSNLTSNEAKKFIELVLLERFRTEISDNEDHSLNYHVYRALKKSLYKPAAFFRGFLFPLIEDGCSVREATIAASVLSKVSIPVAHSSVALTRLLRDQDFNPAVTVFIRVLLEKKYALPYQTLDECVFYFIRFRRAERDLHEPGFDDDMDEDSSKKAKLPPMPVVWHKAFLAFAQRYKNDITDDQRDMLLDTVRQRFHKDIGPEIRRELLAGTARSEIVQGEEATMVDAF